MVILIDGWFRKNKENEDLIEDPTVHLRKSNLS